MRILGIDYGRKRLGLALSDEGAVLASPYPVYSRGYSKKRDLDHLVSLAREHHVKRIVVGLPLNMNGTAGDMVEEVHRFAAEVEQRTGCPVDLFDERLTTSEAERVLVQADVSRKKRKQIRDSLAAVLILQGYLDRRATSPSPATRPET